MDRRVTEILNSRNFAEYVNSQTKLTIIQFQDENNASCQIMTPVFDKLQDYYSDRIVCYIVRKDSASDIWEQFKIYQTPTFLLMKESRTMDKVTGLISYDHFKAIINKYI